MSARDPSGAGEKSSTRLIASNGFGMFMLGIALALGGAFASQSVAKAIITSRSAMERAETLARGSGSSVGALISANQGVIQVVERGTTGSSDYGEYDTRTIEKTLRAVVSLEYAVR